MRSILPSLWAALLLWSLSALANHAQAPTNLVQEANGAPLATGAVIAGGSNVWLTATAPGGTNGPGTYELELEVRPTSQPFQNTPTHSGGILTNKGATAVQWSGLTFTPLAGSWKWQARMRTDSASTPLSAWVPFNAGNTAFTIAPPGVPDIAVAAVTLSNVSTTPSELNFTINGEFQNRGDVSTGNFFWRAWLSSDAKLDGSDLQIFTSTTPVDVPASSTVTASSGNVTVTPRPSSGTYYVLIEADPASPGCTTCGAVAEFDEGNNVGAMATPFVNGTDLVAVSVGNVPPVAGPGSNVTLTVTFFNQGIDNPPAPVNFRVVASRDQQVDSGDSQVFTGSFTFTDPNPVTLPASFTIDPKVAGGDVYWILQLDPPTSSAPNPIVEVSETNNTAVSSAQTHIQQADVQPTFVDALDAVTFQATRKAVMGSPVRFRVQAINKGDFASPPFHIGVVLSTDNNFSLSGDHLFADVPVAAIGVAPNASANYEFTVTVPSTTKSGTPLPVGDYYFFVFLDSFHDINEIDEDNKLMVSGPIRVRTPSADYSVSQITAPAQAAAGEAMTISMTLENEGTEIGAMTDLACFASRNAIIDVGDFPLAFVDASSGTMTTRPVQLGAGETVVRTETVLLPGNMPAAPYYVGCMVDVPDAIPELEEANNTGVSNTTTNVAEQQFRIVTTHLPDAIRDQPYELQLQAVGTNGHTVAWTANPAELPEGLTFTTAGRLTGTPKVVGIWTFDVHATIPGYVAQSVVVVRVFPDSSTLTITTDALRPIVNRTGIPYEASLSAAGGAQPYTWKIVSGTLPGGFSLDGTTGIISGTPKTGLSNGAHELRVRVSDVLGQFAEKAITLRVISPSALTITTLDVPDTVVGAPYVVDFVAAGGSTGMPYTWTVVSGALPEGLVLVETSSETVVLLDGAATTPGVYAFTMMVADHEGRFDTRDYVMTVHPNGLAVRWSEPGPRTFRPGDEVSLRITSNGAEGTRYRVYSGKLPEGLTLSAEGALTGVIADEVALGAHDFVVEAEGPIGGTGLGAFHLELTRPEVASGCSQTGAAPLLPMVISAGLLLIGAARRRRTNPAARDQR